MGRKKDGAAGAEVGVSGLTASFVGGSEVIHHLHGEAAGESGAGDDVEFDDGVAVVVATDVDVERAVADRYKDIAVGIARDAAAGAPDATAAGRVLRVRSGGPVSELIEIGGIKGKHHALAGEAHPNHALGKSGGRFEQQSGTLAIAERIEDSGLELAAHLAGRIRNAADRCRTVGFFLAGGDVEGMNAGNVVGIGGGAFGRARNKVHRVGREIDDWCARDAEIGIDRARILVSKAWDRRDGRAVDEAGVPERVGIERLAIGVEGIDAVGFGNDVHDIVD